MEKAAARARNEPFESGVVSASPERLRLSAKFYLVAVFFVIFDVEALFLYAWSISLRESGWVGFAEAFTFIAILIVSLFYLARIGALDWAPQSPQTQNPRPGCRIRPQHPAERFMKYTFTRIEPEPSDRRFAADEGLHAATANRGLHRGAGPPQRFDDKALTTS